MAQTSKYQHVPKGNESNKTLTVALGLDIIGGGSMVQGQVFFKGRGGLALFLFNFFKVYHFYI